MEELTTEPNANADSADAAQRTALPPEFIIFMAEIGRALCAAGEAVQETRAILDSIAQAYGVKQARIAILPSMVLIQINERGINQTEITSVVRQSLRFDQLDEILSVANAAQQGKVVPAEGLLQLTTIWLKKPRFSRGIIVLGHILLTLGLGLILQPTPPALLACIVLGALVGMLKLFGGQTASFQVLLPLLSSFLVSTLVLIFSRDLSSGEVLRVMILPLVTFLPGAALTTGAEELVYGEIVSGSSRLIAGFLQLTLLSFGMIIATHVVGVLPQETLINVSVNTLGWWAPWLGVAVFGIGNYFHLSASARSLPWFLFTLYITWIGQMLGTLFFAGEFSAFVGGFALIMAVTFSARLGGPPTLITFLPGFWLLVPGASGLFGIAQLLAGNQVFGYQDFIGAMLSILSIVTGMLAAVAVYHALAKRFRWQTDAQVKGAATEANAIQR